VRGAWPRAPHPPLTDPHARPHALADGGQQQTPPNSNNRSRLALLAFLFTNAFILSFVYGLSTSAGGREISWQDFKALYLESGRVSKVRVSNRRTAHVYVRGVDGQDSMAQARGHRGRGGWG
jgi:hypothetical protein